MKYQITQDGRNVGILYVDEGKVMDGFEAKERPDLCIWQSPSRVHLILDSGFEIREKS